MNNEFSLLLQEFNPLPYITNSDKSDHALKKKEDETPNIPTWQTLQSKATKNT